MKNNDLIYDWIDFVAEHKKAKKLVLKEQEDQSGQQGVGIQQVPFGTKFSGCGAKSNTATDASSVDKCRLKSSPRGGNKIQGIVIHHTGTKSPQITVQTLISRGFSTNYEVDQQGRIYEYLNPDQLIAIASNTANRNTVAIDVTTGDGTWPQAQKTSLINLVNMLAKKYNFKISVAPDKGPMEWSKWQGKYTLFRHRNFHATACPSNLPLEDIFKTLVVAENKNRKKILKEQEIKKVGSLDVIVKPGLEGNTNPRNTSIKGIVIHHTHTGTANSTYNVLKQRGLSTNYEVDKDGTIYEYVPPDLSAWATAGGANMHTIAIDVTHVGNNQFPSEQIQALKNLVSTLASIYGFSLKLAPDEGPKKWSEWQADGEGYTLFRHRNFVATSCPNNLPMEELTSGITTPNILTKAYDYIKNIGSSALEKVKSVFTESIDEKLFHVQDKSKNKIYENNKKYFDSLLMFLKKELKITKPVKIVLEEDEKNSKKVLGRTGGYVNQENKIHIFVTNRHVKDVLRSLAHEMVHHRQNIRGEFKKNEPTIHGYAQQNPHLRKMEKEAYLKGNVHFRDWEDNYKYRGER